MSNLKDFTTNKVEELKSLCHSAGVTPGQFARLKLSLETALSDLATELREATKIEKEVPQFYTLYEKGFNVALEKVEAKWNAYLGPKIDEPRAP